MRSPLQFQIVENKGLKNNYVFKILSAGLMLASAQEYLERYDDVLIYLNSYRFVKFRFT